MADLCKEVRRTERGLWLAESIWDDMYQQVHIRVSIGTVVVVVFLLTSK